jgi:salicylate hydroxylase
VAITGDAAHATSPHHGSGAGFCIEDSAILVSLLEDERVNSHKSLAAALKAFNECRTERGHWLVQSSRFTGDLYEWRVPGVGKDFKTIEAEVDRRSKIIDEVNVAKMCDEAVEVLGKLLSSEKA